MIDRLKRMIAILSGWIETPTIEDSKSIRVGKASDGRLFIGMPFAMCEPIVDTKNSDVRLLVCNLTKEDAKWLVQALEKELNW